MTLPNPDTDQLLRQTAAGDDSAAQALLARYQSRLRRMVAVHLDRHVCARIDPSDVVQEALVEAYQLLPRYVDNPTISFYPWIRQIAWQRLIKVHRAHIASCRRSVYRENDVIMSLPDDSVCDLAAQLAPKSAGPEQFVMREEVREHVRAALEELRPQDRILLVMRYLEHMSLKEIGEALQITTAAAKMRHARALQRLERHLRDFFS